MKAPGVGVAAAVLAGDRVLLVRRGAPPAAGCWALPGGRLELGERLEAALRRELREECGLEIEPPEQLELVEAIHPAEAEDGEAYHWLVVTYLARPAGLPSGAAPAEPIAGDDALAARWFGPAELRALDPSQTVPGLHALVARARRRRRRLAAQPRSSRTPRG